MTQAAICNGKHMQDDKITSLLHILFYNSKKR